MTEVSNKIDEEAALWVTRLQSGSLSPEDRRDFDSWIAADSRHQGAFVRLNAVRADLHRLAALSAGKHRELDRDAASDSPVRFNRRWALVGSLAAVTAGAVGTWLIRRPHGDAYVSGIGEQRRVPLADGSRMILNTATETRIHFDEAERQVQLARGEALFDVAKDRSRPFVVRAGDVIVKAVGTQFAVRLERDHVDVTVTEGIVEITNGAVASTASSADRPRVAADQHAIVTRGKATRIEPMQPEEVARRLAWRDGMVSFNGEPLNDAVAEINRHNRRRIVVDDPAIATRPIVGLFRATDVDTFARTAATVVGAEAVDDGDVIRLDTRKAR